MKTIRIGKLEILGLNFVEEFESYFQSNSDAYFFQPPGREDMRLLAYLSIQFKNATLLNVSSSPENSALALSYNKSNTVHSISWEDKPHNPLIRTVPTLRFEKANLWDNQTAQTYKTVIQSCPLIFLDIDPHDGVKEYEFYKYLKEIDYKGILLCDDIHHFEGMRKFWYFIQEDEKHDLTRFGHWSGTGLINFNKKVRFEFVG